jgi:hypothetical protein
MSLVTVAGSPKREYLQEAGEVTTPRSKFRRRVAEGSKNEFSPDSQKLAITAIRRTALLSPNGGTPKDLQALLLQGSPTSGGSQELNRIGAGARHHSVREIFGGLCRESAALPLDERAVVPFDSEHLDESTVSPRGVSGGHILSFSVRLALSEQITSSQGPIMATSIVFGASQRKTFFPPDINPRNFAKKINGLIDVVVEVPTTNKTVDKFFGRVKGLSYFVEGFTDKSQPLHFRKTIYPLFFCAEYKHGQPVEIVQGDTIPAQEMDKIIANKISAHLKKSKTIYTFGSDQVFDIAGNLLGKGLVKGVTMGIYCIVNKSEAVKLRDDVNQRMLSQFDALYK